MDYFKGKVKLLEKIRISRSKESRERSKEMVDNSNISKCEFCDSLFTDEDLKKNSRVCPVCGRNFHIDVIERLDDLMDSGYSLIEFELKNPNPLGFPNYDEKRSGFQESTGYDEAVVICKGKIRDESCYVFVMNKNFMMASMGLEVGQRIRKCFDLASEENLPVVGFCASGGARMQEGTYSLMQMANTSFAVREHSDKGNFYLAVLTDPTTGGVSASFASLADITIAEPKARIGFTGRRVIEQTIGEKLPDDFQTTEFLFEHGFLDAIVSREKQREYISRLLNYHRRAYEN